jgi:flagellar L-ring protein FlgH
MRKWLQVGIAVALLSCGVAGSMALADDGPLPAPNNQPTPDNQSATSDVTPLAPAPVAIGVLTERNGGSLARAMLSSKTDSTDSTTSPYSYFAVPEPQPKLLKKHDLVTIIVNETSTYTANGTTDLEKTADFESVIDNYISLRLSHLALVGQNPANPLQIVATGQRDVKGTAQFERDDTLTARITATVVDVKPNGTLVLEASEKIKNDDEEQTMVLTGQCRVEDVGADNTLLSTQLYDLHLSKTQKGEVRDTTKRGLFPRLLDWIDPF